MRTATPDEPASDALGAAQVADAAAIAFECAQRDGVPFALACFAIEGVDDTAELGPKPAQAVRTLARLALEGDAPGRVFAWRRRTHLVIAFEGATLAQAEQRTRHVLAAARSLPEEERSVHAVAGLAAVQSGGACWFEVLLAVAEEGVAVASASGFGGVAHTELYGLVETKIARALGPYRPRAGLPPPSPGANAAHATSTPPMHSSPTAPSATPTAAARALEPVERDAPLSAVTSAATAAPLDDEARRAQIETYERRIAKLLRALEEAQRELSSRAPAGPTTTAPITEVRVRTQDEIEEKRALFARLLEQNLALRDALRHAS